MSSCSIDLVVHHQEPGYREVERRIREWSGEQVASLEVCTGSRGLESVADRFRRTAADEGPGRILVSMGFEPSEVRQALRDLGNDTPLEVILFRYSFEHSSHAPPSASLTTSRENSSDLAHLPEALRKALVRLRSRRNGISIREIQPAELPDYFSLRFHVYASMGYVPDDSNATAAGLELHYSDAWSLPIGAFDRIGRLIGCARLVSESGVLNNYRAVIEQLVREREDVDPKLRTAWSLPREPMHPFDLLGPFDGFDTYYSRLVRDRVPKAEVSRVIVSPGFRQQGLGEVIVDSVVSTARDRGIELLFLACAERHRHFYERSGFRAIDGMHCDRFGAYPVAAIAMDQRL